MKKNIFDQQEVAPILDRQGNAYPELVASLTGEQATSADMLYSTATLLLEQNGIESTVNGVDARVTQDFAFVQLGNRDYRARVAQIGGHKRGRSQATPAQTMIVFDEDDSMRVRTASPFAISFRDFAGNTDLVVANNMDPLVGDDRYAKLVQDILTSIGEKATLRRENAPGKLQTLQDRLTSRRPARIVVENYFNSNERLGKNSLFETKGDRRRFVRGVLGVTALLYVHTPFTNSDAHIGPLPMPAPIELAVDIGNMPDHAATGFDVPAGATQLVIGDAPSRLALLPDYDTSGAPDTTYKDLNGAQYNESKAGLYALTVPESDTRYDRDMGKDMPLTNPATDCYVVRANTSGGRTLVFTQTPQLLEQVTVQAVSAESVEVCPVGDIKLDDITEGKIYFYQSSN